MRRKTNDEFIERLKNANPLIEVVGEYVNSRTKVKVRGVNCGHIWDSLPYDLLNGHGCPTCRYINNSERTKKSNDQFLIELKKINPNIEPLEEYVTSQKPIKVRCNQCNNEWIVKPNTLLNGAGCANCAGLKKKTTEEYVEELKHINPSIEVLGEYDGQRSRILVRCKNCHYEWEPSAKALLMGRGCPECNKAGTSFMEQFILAALKKELGEDKVVNRDRNTIGKELDIYIPSKAIAIEPGSWYWHKNNLEKDIEKRVKCKEYGIRVITIYDSFPIKEKAPFQSDCYVFEDQLNEPGYCRLKNLVEQLYLIVGIKKDINESYWDDIIEQAYKAVSKITHEEFVDLLTNVSPFIELKGIYYGTKTNVRVACKKCGYEWETTPYSLLKGVGCRSCLGLKKKTNEEFINQMINVNPQIEVVSEYINANTKVKVRNKICGHEWDAYPNVLLKGHNCPICAGNRRKTQEQFVEELHRINPYVTVIGKYSNALTKIEIQCDICGRSFLMTPNRLLSGYGCKYCSNDRKINYIDQ